MGGPVHDVTGRSASARLRTPDPAETNRMSHGVASTRGGATRRASPMKSGRDPGVPPAFDTLTTTSDDGTGSPVDAGATRSIEPDAMTPTGWKIRLPRIADPH